MKKYLPFAIVLLLALASISFGQEAAKAKATPSPTPKPHPAMSKAQLQKHLAATEKKLWEAWKNKDTKPFKSWISADGVIVGENGVQGKSDILKFVGESDCTVKSYELSDFKVTMLNSGAALLTYKGTADGTCGGTAVPPVWASTIYVNRGGKWLAFSHQETAAK